MNLSHAITLMNDSMGTTLASDNSATLIEAMGDNFAIAVIFGVGGLITIIAILLTTVTRLARTKEIEKTKRELAAYVAEGSMTPSDAERLLKSDKHEA